MRRLLRVQQIADLLSAHGHQPRTRWPICRSCRLRATHQRLPSIAPFSSSAPHREDISERLRNAVWGKEEADRQRRGAAIEGSEHSGTSVGARKQTEELAEDKTYREATTWDDLEWVGGDAWADRLQDTGDHFKGFLTSRKAVSSGEAVTAISKAVREIDILKSLGLPLDTSSSASIAAILEHVVGAAAYPNDAQCESQLKEILSGQLGAEEIEGIRLERALEVPLQESLPAIDLQDVAYKFAVIKRVMQLTGVRIPDPAIDQCISTVNLFDAITAKPKPKKLAQLLEDSLELEGMPNVKVAKRRVTPIDKEKELGRWKVIEKELMNRGLPVVGH